MYLKVGTLQIAERRSIKVKDESIEIKLRSDDSDSDSGCSGASASGSCVGQVKSREIIFTLEFIGKVASNQVLFNTFDNYFNSICSSNSVQWQRRVCDETLEEFIITGAYMKRLLMDQEKFGVRTGEVHLFTAEEGTTEIAIWSWEALPPSVTA